MGEWTVVLRGDWYLPHLVNMLKEYKGNSEQRECRDEMVEQIESQMISDGSYGVTKTTRPLVVIDPEDRDQVARLRDALRPHRAVNLLANWQQALREFAQPTPPKPEEPLGLGAVVEDAKRHKFVRVAERYDGSAKDRDWQRIGGELNAVRNFGWQHIDAVTVLSEGVTP